MIPARPLVTLADAKASLYITDPARDAEVASRVLQASAAVLAKCDTHADETWDETTAPPVVRAATLLWLGLLFEHRGDDLTASEDHAGAVMKQIEMLLKEVLGTDGRVMQTKTAPPSIGQDRHLVTFETPGPAIPDGHGGFSRTWTPLDPPTWYVAIRPATAADVERAIAGTLLTHRSYLIHGRYHPGVTFAARMVFDGDVYQVTSVVNVDERDREMLLVADLQE